MRTLGLLVIFISFRILAQPTITLQPTNTTVYPGKTGTFTVSAAPDCSLTYQWLLNGTNLPNGIITTVAGAGNHVQGDDGSVQIATLSSPQGVFVDSQGNIIIADTGDDTIRMVKTNGIISRVAGVGFDNNTYFVGGTAVSIGLKSPTDVTADSAGNIYFTDQANHRVAKVDTNGVLTTIAGFQTSFTVHPGFSGDGGPATSAKLNSPTGLAFDSAGNLFIADRSNNRVRKVDTNGIITTVAGQGGFGYTGDGGQATNAVLNAPCDVLVDAVGNLFIADAGNSVIREVDTNGIITTIAGNGTGSFGGDGGPATNAQLNLPQRLLFDKAGNLLIADTANGCIRKVDTNGIITTPAGLSFFSSPEGISMDSAGNLFIAEAGFNRIRKYDTNGILSVVAGFVSPPYTGDTGPATNARLSAPNGVVVDRGGNLFVADQTYQRIRRVTPEGIITTIAGIGTAGFAGDGGLAALAQLNNPSGITMDTAGNLFIADANNQRIRKIDTHGIITTVAGNGTAALSGDNDFATNASLNMPVAVAFNNTGSLLIADRNNSRIRMVDTNGIITTVAGTVGSYSGDGGFATNASLLMPTDIAADAVGNMFIADRGNHRIRKVDTNGIITTIAGTNNTGFSGDGGLAITNLLNTPSNVAVDRSGCVWIVDQGNKRIRKIDTNGIITTMIGNGTSGAGGDGGPASSAQLSFPTYMTFDLAGNVFFSDLGNFSVRKISFSDTPTLILLGVSSNNIGNYQAIVSGSCGTVTSSVASLFFPPQIQTGNSGFGPQSNLFSFTIFGFSNQTVVVEASTNLNAGWEPLETNVLGVEPFDFADPASTNYSERFYRVRIP